MSSITVSHVAGDRFAIELGEHTLMVDQPIQDGGEGTAPTPTELFVASLASCVALRSSLPRQASTLHGGLDRHRRLPDRKQPCAGERGAGRRSGVARCAR